MMLQTTHLFPPLDCWLLKIYTCMGPAGPPSVSFEGPQATLQATGSWHRLILILNKVSICQYLLTKSTTTWQNYVKFFRHWLIFLSVYYFLFIFNFIFCYVFCFVVVCSHRNSMAESSHMVLNYSINLAGQCQTRYLGTFFSIFFFSW